MGTKRGMSEHVAHKNGLIVGSTLDVLIVAQVRIRIYECCTGGTILGMAQQSFGPHCPSQVGTILIFCHFAQAMVQIHLIKYNCVLQCLLPMRE